MKKASLLYTIIIFLIYSNCLSAQETKFRHLDASTELPSSTVYQVFQDSKKYIWFTSEAGLSRYDGEYVQNFTMEDGLADNEIFGLYEDSQGRIWMRAFNGKSSYFQNGLVYNENDFEYLKKMSSPSWVTSILEDSHQNVYFSLSRSGLMILTQDNEVIKIKSVELLKLLQDYSKTTQTERIFKNKPSVTGFKELSDGQMCIFTSQAEFSYDFQAQKLSVKNVFTEEINNMYFVNDDVILGTKPNNPDIIYHYKNNVFTPVFDGKTISTRSLIPMFLNTKGQLWLGTLGKGAFAIDNFLTNPVLTKHLLTDKAVSSYIEDSEGNQWFSTLGHGAYMKRPSEVLTYTTKQNLTTDDLYAVNADDEGNIYVGGRDGSLHLIDKNRSVRLLTGQRSSEHTYDRISDILVDDNQRIWISGDLGLRVFGKSVNFDEKNVKALSKDNLGNVYAATNVGVFKIPKKGKVTKIWNRRATAVAPNDDGTVWIGTNRGLYYFDGDTTIYLKSENELLGYKVTQLKQTTDGTLCICSGNGVILKRGKKVAHLTQREDNIVGNVCKALYIEKGSNTVWVGASTGISEFKIEANDTAIYNLVNYSQADNLASNDIRGVYADNGRVWVATSSGLSYFEAKNDKYKSIAPPIYITSVRIWEEEFEIDAAYNLSYSQNNIHIGYTGISYQSGNRIRYKYTMEGIDTGWHYSSVPEIQYPDLQPGFYTFKVLAINVDGEESKFLAEIEFTINSPWWEKWWFRLISFLVVSIAAYLIISYTIRNRKYKEQLQRQIVESEQMALRAQMNPHFVFNALNSIQHFITMEDEMSANYYLTRFSKLIRQVLENSKHSFITLNEEIETLKLYLELEMLRFEGKFEYQIDMEDDISDYDVEIPSMIIQPFLENAIWHGLMPKVGDSRLKLYFAQTDDFIICTVEDNGIGREAAAVANKGRDEKHKSTGIANTVKRLKLLSNAKDDDKLMQITDMEKDGAALGTLVTLKIPYK